MSDDRDVDLPFEEVPIHGQALDPDTLIAAGVTVAAAAVPVGDQVMPALLFRFFTPDMRGFHPPVLMIQTDELMAKTRPLIQEAIAAARRAAAAGVLPR